MWLASVAFLSRVLTQAVYLTPPVRSLWPQEALLSLLSTPASLLSPLCPQTLAAEPPGSSPESRVPAQGQRSFGARYTGQVNRQVTPILFSSPTNEVTIVSEQQRPLYSGV